MPIVLGVKTNNRCEKHLLFNFTPRTIGVITPIVLGVKTPIVLGVKSNNRLKMSIIQSVKVLT